MHKVRSALPLSSSETTERTVTNVFKKQRIWEEMTRKTILWGKKRRNVWRVKEKFLSLHRERNLFRMGAPFGTASDSLK